MSAMSRRNAITALPRNLETGLNLLERGHALRNRGQIEMGTLPPKVLEFLNRLEAEEIEWVLVGAEAINLYLLRPRATVDVDIVVRQKHLRKAKKIVNEAAQEVRDTEVHFHAVLSPDPNRLELDVIKSQSHRLFEAALDHATVIEGVRVPKLEALLALKYRSTVSPWRQVADKHQDVADFIHAFKDNQGRIDRALLVELASRAHERGPVEFPAFLEAVEKDRPLTI
jgi:Nucleotidyl transferase AbiEii toxin, Type IV TA system